MTIKLDLSAFAGERVLCAVSGGADSICLLHLLYSGGADVIAAHYEHGIRGGESLRDARFVEDWCAERGIECVVGHGDVPGYALAHGLGTEEAARRLRYEFLQSTAQERGCGLIATAHNADDNAETLIFNLTRGSGALGLRGIPARRDNIIRPLLGVSREQIEQYLAENGIGHIEDSTNGSDDYSRNLIRHKVMPVLRQINPALSEAAGRTAELLGRDEDCLSSLASDFVEKNFRGGSLPAKELCALHPAIASRVLRQLLGTGLTMEQTDAALRLCRGTGVRSLDITGRRLVCDQGRLYLTAQESVTLKVRAVIPGTVTDLPEAGLRMSAEFTEYGEEINGLFKTYYIKYENIDSAVICTGRRPGDRMRPLGRGCTKSLKSLFMEAGFSQNQRDTAPVIRDDKGILAVCGIAVDERAAPKTGDRALKISFSEI